MIKRFIAMMAVVMLCVAPIAGCVTVPADTAAKIKAATLKTCQTAAQLEAGYTVLKNSDALKPATVKKADVAFAAIDSFCSTSQDWDPANAAIQVALLYVQVTQAMKSIKNDT